MNETFEMWMVHTKHLYGRRVRDVEAARQEGQAGLHGTAQPLGYRCAFHNLTLEIHVCLQQRSPWNTGVLATLQPLEYGCASNKVFYHFE